MEIENLDPDALYTGFRPNVEETLSNKKAKKAQNRQNNESLNFGRLIVDHLGSEIAKNESVRNFDTKLSPEELLLELKARAAYVAKLEELRAWIQSSMMKA